MMRRAVVGIAALGLLVGMLGPGISRAEDDEFLQVLNRDNWELANVSSANSWSRTAPWWEAWNQASGTAYVKLGESRQRLEAQSICNPPRAFHQAASKVVYKWIGGYHGTVLVRPFGSIHGQLVTRTAGAGSGEGEAKVTLEIKDLTAQTTEVSETIHKENSPELIKDLLAKQDELDKRTKNKSLSENWYSFHMNSGHVYEATVKLWTECATWGFYHVRTDYSRHTLSTSENPLIGMVFVEKLTFDFRGARWGSGEDDH